MNDHHVFLPHENRRVRPAYVARLLPFAPIPLIQAANEMKRRQLTWLEDTAIALMLWMAALVALMHRGDKPRPW